MSKEFPLTPQKVAPVQTRYRRIATAFPAPQSIPLLKKLRSHSDLPVLILSAISSWLIILSVLYA
jgi:hypothetical protein